MWAQTFQINAEKLKSLIFNFDKKSLGVDGDMFAEPPIRSCEH